MNKKAISIFLVLFLIVVIIGGIVYFSPLKNTVLSPTFTPIYCNDYEFTCCNEQKASTYDYKWGNIQGNLFTCDVSADRCYVDFTGGSAGAFNNIELYKTRSLSTCQFKSGLFTIDGYYCSDYQSLSTIFKGDIKPGDTIYLEPADLSTPAFNIHIETYKSRLDFCGKAGCTVGVPVSGADKCTFQTDKGIYGTGGNLIKNPSTTSTSYTVPKTTCVLAYQSGDRHICGNREEQCKVDIDCGGHTYGNYECNARTLQQYGCKKYIDPNSQQDYDTGWTLGDDLSYTAARCEISSARQVQCCGDTDCGTNAFCDTNPSSATAWTCKQTVQCTQNTQCGISQQCDYTSKQIKIPICSSGTCSYTTKDVQCCSDVNCPQGYFCGVDNTCKQSATPKQSCPYACCIQQPDYFDRPCAAGQTCCGDNQCQTSCNIAPAGTCKPLIDIIAIGFKIDNPFCGFKEKLSTISIIGGVLGSLFILLIGYQNFARQKGRKKPDMLILAIVVIFSLAAGFLIYLLIQSAFDFIFSFWGILTIIIVGLILIFLERIKGVLGL